MQVTSLLASPSLRSSSTWDEFLDQRKELSLLKPDVCVKQSVQAFAGATTDLLKKGLSYSHVVFWRKDDNVSRPNQQTRNPRSETAKSGVRHAPLPTKRRNVLRGVINDDMFVGLPRPAY